jgi:hypothetical protein
MPKEELKPASAKALDFTNVKDGGGLFNKKRQPAGDYRAKVTKVVDSPAKKDGTPQWLFTIQVGTGTYPLYCKLVPEQLWKLRNLLMAAGLNVPKQRLKVDPNKVVNREIAVTLDDDEYDDGDKVHKQSVVTATFPLSELDPDANRDTEDEADDDDDDEEEDDTPPPAKKSKKAPPPEEDDEDEDDEEEEPAPPKKKSKKAPEPEDDDDDDDEDEEPEPPKKKKKAAKPADDDDELDELEIDL